MKKIIAIIGILFIGTVLFSSCKARQKCAAYGHHTYYETVTSETTQS